MNPDHIDPIPRDHRDYRRRLRHSPRSHNHILRQFDDAVGHLAMYQQQMIVDMAKRVAASVPPPFLDPDSPKPWWLRRGQLRLLLPPRS